MAEKKPKRATEGRPVTVAESTSLRLEEPVRRALESFLRAQRIPPTVPATIVTALIEFLEKEGFPPSWGKEDD